jgi:hypothetical protein
MKFYAVTIYRRMDTLGTIKSLHSIIDPPLFQLRMLRKIPNKYGYEEIPHEFLKT